MDCTKEHIDQQRILSFCYGYGGLERGINAVMPIRPVAYVEIEAFQNFNLVAAMEAGLVDKAPIWTNLKTFDARPFHNRIHGIVGGYPCQGESLAGKRQLWNDNRFLWPYIERAVEAAQPLWVGFENVSGHISGSFPYVLDSLREMGYAVEAGLFTASEVGAPHKRERLFIFGINKNAFDREFWERVANSTGGYGCNQQIRDQNKITTPESCKSQLAHTGSIEGGLSQSIGWNEEAQTSGGSEEHELGNTPGPDKQRFQFESRYEKKQIGGSGEVGHITGQGLQESGLNGQRKLSEEKRKGIHDRSKQSSHDMAYSDNSGSGENWESSELWSDGIEQSPGNSGNTSKGENKEGGFYGWPSRPGEKQHQWEEKRTVESGVGCTVNGYNFRTELLRQYGNGVVSQQAANAFETLIMKLLKDNKIL